MGGQFGTYSTINSSDGGNGGWLYDNTNVEESYASNYKDGYDSSQRCTGAHFFTDEDPSYPMDIKFKQFYIV